MAAPDPPHEYCPTCGVAYEPLQEYCLECGTRLPTNRGVVGVLASAWQRRIPWYPGDWIWPVLFFLVLTVIATAAAVAASSSGASAAQTTYVATSTPVTVGPGVTQQTVPTVTPTSTLPTAPRVTVTTGPLPHAPGAPSTNSVTTPAPNPNALAAWPAGKDGYTNVLESLPLAAGHASAVARARAAKRAGLPDVGVLTSSQYSSLHPGYYVVFSGIYATQSDAGSAVSTAHAKGFPDAYQTRITR